MTVVINKNENDNEKRLTIRWNNRRRMAWLSFWFMIIFTFTLWFILPVWYKYMDVDQEHWIENITNSSEWLYITFGSVIIGYMGSTAYMLKGKQIEVNESDY